MIVKSFPALLNLGRRAGALEDQGRVQKGLTEPILNRVGIKVAHDYRTSFGVAFV